MTIAPILTAFAVDVLIGLAIFVGLGAAWLAILGAITFVTQTIHHTRDHSRRIARLESLIETAEKLREARQ